MSRPKGDDPEVHREQGIGVLLTLLSSVGSISNPRSLCRRTIWDEQVNSRALSHGTEQYIRYRAFSPSRRELAKSKERAKAQPKTLCIAFFAVRERVGGLAIPPNNPSTHRHFSHQIPRSTASNGGGCARCCSAASRWSLSAYCLLLTTYRVT
jgi:hypothetical protein